MINIEEVKSDYFDASALEEVPYQLYRFETGNKRFYYECTDEGIVFMPSVTTFIHATLPTSQFLIDWQISMGKDKAKEEMMRRAAYGTSLHALVAEFLINNNLSIETKDIEAWLMEKFIDDKQFMMYYRNEWLWDLQYDLLAYAQFVYDHDVKPLAIELPLKYRSFAGSTDLIAELTTKTAGRHRGLLDLKSGRKGFYESHIVQLEVYRRAYNENFPNSEPIIYTYNISPKEWRKKPDYNFKEQSREPFAEIVDYLMWTYEKIGQMEPGTIVIPEGRIWMNKQPIDCYKEVNIKEFLMSRHYPKGVPEKRIIKEESFDGELPF